MDAWLVQLRKVKNDPEKWSLQCFLCQSTLSKDEVPLVTVAGKEVERKSHN